MLKNCQQLREKHKENRVLNYTEVGWIWFGRSPRREKKLVRGGSGRCIATQQPQDGAKLHFQTLQNVFLGNFSFTNYISKGEQFHNSQNKLVLRGRTWPARQKTEFLKILSKFDFLRLWHSACADVSKNINFHRQFKILVLPLAHFQTK